MPEYATSDKDTPMSKNQLLKIVNPIFFILVFLQFLGIVVSKFIDFDWQYKAHVYGGYAIGIVIVIHLYLNWTWIRNTYFKKKISVQQK
jgi:hypothetical protein